MRSNKHSRIPPTREIFVPATSGTGASQKGTHTGYILDDDNDDAWIELYVPHDYHGFYECVLVAIGINTLATQTINVDSDYGQKNDYSQLCSQGAFLYTLTGVGADQIIEIDITNVINGDATTRAIMRGDYVGIHAEATTSTDLVVLGVRFRYKVFKHK